LKKVLLVEDSQTILSLIQVYLMGAGLEFVVASTGKQGLARCKELRPDLVIADVSMPEMNGFEMCSSIRSDPVLHDTPVLLLTGLKDEGSREKGRLVGASGFLSKPITPELLRARVKELLGLEVTP
jgi:twitching motility two-component system response regulator PilG